MRPFACLALGAVVALSLPSAAGAQATGQTAPNTDVRSIWEQFKGSWSQTKGAVKEQWGKLTDDDLDQISGRREQLEGKIQERYGVAKDRAKSEIDDWYNRQQWLS